MHNRSFVRSFVRSLAQTVLHTQQYHFSQAITCTPGEMYVSHTAMLAATAWLSFWSAITREGRSKRLAGRASPSADSMRYFRISVSMPSLSAQMFFCCVGTLFARGVKDAERTTMPASYGTCTKRTGSNSSLPCGNHRVPELTLFSNFSHHTHRAGDRHCALLFSHPKGVIYDKT